MLNIQLISFVPVLTIPDRDTEPGDSYLEQDLYPGSILSPQDGRPPSGMGHKVYGNPVIGYYRYNLLIIK